MFAFYALGGLIALFALFSVPVVFKARRAGIL
jgi:predicted alpha/beta superfamily hydrolase